MGVEQADVVQSLGAKRRRTPSRVQWADGIAAILGFLAPLVAAVAWIPVRASNSNVEVALILVVIMTGAGVTGRRRAVVASAVSAALAFTFFDTKPYERFAISRQPDIETAVWLTVVGLITGELAVRVFRQRRNEQSSAGNMSRVREAANLLATGEELVVMIGAVAEKLTRLLELRECWFSMEPVGAGIRLIDRQGSVAAGAYGADLALPVWGLGEVLGHFLLRPTSPESCQQHRLLVAITLADQVGAALCAQAPMPPPSTGTPSAPPPARNLHVVE